MPRYRVLEPHQRSQVWLGGPDLSAPELVLETTDLLVEAPNWTLDGTRLVLNGNGVLWMLDPDLGTTAEPLEVRVRRLTGGESCTVPSPVDEHAMPSITGTPARPGQDLAEK